MSSQSSDMVRGTIEGSSAFAELVQKPRALDADKIDLSACPSFGKLAYQINLMLAVRRVILTKHLMEPHCGLRQHIRSLPGIPRQVGLRLACDQTPVDRRYVILLGDWQ